MHRAHLSPDQLQPVQLRAEQGPARVLGQTRDRHGGVQQSRVRSYSLTRYLCSPLRVFSQAHHPCPGRPCGRARRGSRHAPRHHPGAGSSTVGQGQGRRDRDVSRCLRFEWAGAGLNGAAQYEFEQGAARGVYRGWRFACVYLRLAYYYFLAVISDFAFLLL